MTPNRHKSATKSGSRKRSAGASQAAPSQELSSTADPGRPSKRRFWIAAPVATVVVAAIGLAFQFLHRDGSTGNAPGASVANFVGSETCAGCHQAQAQLWQSSQHKLAMQHAGEKTVLGDFNNASFDYYGVRSRFFRKDGRYFVETDGPDGRLATFEIKYTFGVDPLPAISKSSSLTVVCRRCRSLGTAARSYRAVSAGFIFIPMRKSSTAMFCTGPS